jgi:shikimate 5-dehydrogenase
MDINYNQQSRFIQKATEAGATIIDGYAMFVEQAILQFNYWFENNVQVI